jgi:cytochrome b561
MSRSGQPTYGRMIRSLHWTTVAAVVAQFTVGYSLDVDGGRGRGRGRGGESGRGRGRGGDDLDVFGDDTLLTIHVVLGVSILLLVSFRLLWRLTTTLPPWAEGLSPFERKLAHRTEQALYAVLFAIPLSGLWLVLVSDDAVAFHIAFHVAFFVAVAAHLGLVFKHQLVDRDHFLRRMI